MPFHRVGRMGKPGGPGGISGCTSGGDQANRLPTRLPSGYLTCPVVSWRATSQRCGPKAWTGPQELHSWAGLRHYLGGGPRAPRGSSLNAGRRRRDLNIAGLATPSMAVAKGAWGRVVLPGASEALVSWPRRRGPAKRDQPRCGPTVQGQPRRDPACWVNHGQLWVKGGKRIE